MRRLIVALAVVGVGVGLLLHGQRTRPVPPPTVVPPARPTASVEGVRRAATPLPASLRGTSPDGWLDTDERAKFVPSREVRRFFDYYLGTTGEEPPARARARLIAAIRSRLPPAAAADAIRLLHRYLAYLRHAPAVAARAADAEERLGRLRALRRATLGDDAARAFFADDEALEEAALARRRLAADPALDPDERARRAAAVEAALPAPVREARAAAVAPLQLMQEEAQLRARGASAEDIRALREGAVGTAAADRLDALDRERAAWEARLTAYRTARDALARAPDLDDVARARALAALLAGRFTPEEQLRVQALDRIAAARAGAAAR